MGKYKPRVRKFNVHGKEYDIDTRMGKNGLYPGDILENPIDKEHILILGVSSDNKIVYADNTDEYKGIYEDYSGLIKSFSVIYKRHGQHLIDSGEMIQC